MQEFINGISQFSVKGDKEAKLKCNKKLHFIKFSINIFVLLFKLRSRFMILTGTLS